MASGKLGSANLPAGGTGTLLYTVPVGMLATINIRFANRNASSAKIRLAIGTGANPAVTDYLSYDQPITGNGIIEDTGIVCSAGEKVWAISDLTNISVRVHGYEEAA